MATIDGIGHVVPYTSDDEAWAKRFKEFERVRKYLGETIPSANAAQHAETRLSRLVAAHRTLQDFSRGYVYGGLSFLDRASVLLKLSALLGRIDAWQRDDPR